MTINNNTISIRNHGIATSKDGTIISYHTTGSGPGLILIHGVLSTSAHYRALAEFLGKNFTVYSIDRRGRGLSGEQGDDYSIVKECEDIEALRQQTGAIYLFGHSYGGLIALEVTRSNRQFKKIAVYEPGVSVDGSISIDWIPAYQKYMAADKYLNAFAVFSIGAGPENARKTPLWLMKLLLPFFVKKPEREEMYSLLPANLLEHKAVASRDNMYENYQQISADVLLMYGGKSNLRWVDKAIKTLSEVLPVSEKRKFPKLDHFGPDKTGPEVIAENLTKFFAGKK